MEVKDLEPIIEGLVNNVEVLKNLMEFLEERSIEELCQEMEEAKTEGS